MTRSELKQEAARFTSEERERIVKYLETRANYWSRLAKEESVASTKYINRRAYATALRKEAREIRSGKHHEREESG